MNPQTWRTRDEGRKRVRVEGNYPAKHCEDQRVPSKCGKKVAMKELYTASRHSARHTRQASDVVKNTMRPRQPECEPSRRQAEGSERRAQPDQLVIDFSPVQAARHDP